MSVDLSGIKNTYIEAIAGVSGLAYQKGFVMSPRNLKMFGSLMDHMVAGQKAEDAAD